MITFVRICPNISIQQCINWWNGLEVYSLLKVFFTQHIYIICIYYIDIPKESSKFDYWLKDNRNLYKDVRESLCMERYWNILHQANNWGYRSAQWNETTTMSCVDMPCVGNLDIKCKMQKTIIVGFKLERRTLLVETPKSAYRRFIALNTEPKH